MRALLRDDTAGDPMGRRGVWTGKRLRAISRELAQLGLRVCPNTVRRLLTELDYALHANRKSLCSNHPLRDEQFGYLNYQRQEFRQLGYPIISVDSKKKELVGQFKNHGQVWSRAPIPVQDHDFRSQAKGLATPYGVYDLSANRATVVVGTSHDTPDFAVDAICQWWRQNGRRRYPEAPELLILADSGGSNGPQCRAWKWALQEKLVDSFGLTVTVCHYPTGASKWNPVEHRLFSEISKHWAGQPLKDYPTIVRLIGETHTQTGLHVNCALSTRYYPTKVQISAEQMAHLDLLKHTTLPQWNYTLFPRTIRN
ncbi:MAG TPA: ISAzo13 family transposase [Anaerolineales bacterium]